MKSNSSARWKAAIIGGCACLLLLGLWGTIAKQKAAQRVALKAGQCLLHRLPAVKMGMTQTQVHAALGVTPEMPHAGISNERIEKEGWPIGDNRLLVLVYHRESEFTEQPPARLIRTGIISQ